MTITATLALIAASLTGTTCAAIDNGPNMAAWATPAPRVQVTTYADRGGRLMYANAPGKRANKAWRALHAAELGLTEGKAGHKVTLACID